MARPAGYRRWCDLGLRGFYRAQQRGHLAVALVVAAAFTDLLQLPEAPEWRFRTSMRGADITVGPVALLIGWISGRSLPDLADVHLAAAPQAAWRIEQMVGTITEQFEHYLSWTVGALVELVNGLLVDADSKVRLCLELGGYIRYGVNTPHAHQLMTSVSVRGGLPTPWSKTSSNLEPTHEDLRSWLAGMGIAEWRERYQASASEVLDLLEFTRLRSRSLLTTLLETGAASVNLPPAHRQCARPRAISLTRAGQE